MTIKKDAILILFLIFGANCFGHTSSKIKKNSDELKMMRLDFNSKRLLDSIKISNLESAIQTLKIQQDFQNNFQNTANGNISNQIGSLNNSLSYGGVFFTIFGLFAGFYVTMMLRKSAENLHQSELILNKQNKIKEDIDNNLENLFERLNQKEIDYVFDRLESSPYDLHQLYHVLACRDLNSKYFNKIKYLLEKWDVGKPEQPFFNQIISLLRLSVQHFPKLSIKDRQIFRKILNHPDEIFSGAYPEEMENFLNEYSFELYENGLEGNQKNLTDLLRFFDSTKEQYGYLFSVYSLPINIFYKKLNSKLNRFKLANIIKKNNFDKLGKIIYPRLIKDYEGFDKLSDNDKILITEIKIKYENIKILEPIKITFDDKKSNEKLREISGGFHTETGLTAKNITYSNNHSKEKWLKYFFDKKEDKEKFLHYLSKNTDSLKIVIRDNE